MKEGAREVIRIVSATYTIALLLGAILLYIDILVPDSVQPNDPKPNLEEDLLPIKLGIVKTFVIAAIPGAIFLFLSRKKKKNIS